MQASAAARTTQQGALEVLTFDLSGEIFALEAILVREVLDQCPETQVPGAPGFVDAMINFAVASYLLRIFVWPSG